MQNNKKQNYNRPNWAQTGLFASNAGACAYSSICNFAFGYNVKIVLI